jgi:hypothetical protein
MVTAENYPRQFCYIAYITYLQANLILMWTKTLFLLVGAVPYAYLEETEQYLML